MPARVIFYVMSDESYNTLAPVSPLIGYTNLEIIILLED